MQYEADRTDPTREKWGEPSLAEMTEKAIKMLKRNDKGFFLLVEGKCQQIPPLCWKHEQ